MDGLSGDMSQELESFTVEISSFEETLKTSRRRDDMKGKTLIILGFLAAAGVILYCLGGEATAPGAPGSGTQARRRRQPRPAARRR